MPFRESGMRDQAKPWLLALAAVAPINTASRAQARPDDDAACYRQAHAGFAEAAR
jgi:hypothetical protein